jgi:hypothetical protein
MSQGTNSERITQNNAIINDNNTDLDTIRTKMAEIFEPVNLQSKEVTITENGTTTIEPDEGYDGLSDVDVTVATSGADLSEYFTDKISTGYQKTALQKSIKKIPMMTIQGTSADFLFSYCENLEEVPLLNTSNIMSMNRMFESCGKLKNVPLFDTSRVANTGFMLSGCSSLESVPAFNLSACQNTYAMFESCRKLIEIPLMDTSNVTTMRYMFNDCTNLVTVPLLNTSKVSVMAVMFSNCPNLSNESLNNILAMCANSVVTSDKTLKSIGLSSTQATTCQTLSNYQAFLDAGWTIGY